MTMTLTEAFKNRFLNAYASQGAGIKQVVLAMAACLLLSAAIDLVYCMRTRKHGVSRRFMVSLTAVSLITLAFVLTIESSIVVSLGMIGALSVIRYRMAVKGPMEMMFLVWSVSVGIICGAGLYYIAVPLTALVGLVVLLSGRAPGAVRNRLLALDGRYPYDAARLESVLKRHARWHRVRTENIHNGDVNLVIELHRTQDEAALIEEIREMSDFHDATLQTQEGVVD